MKLHLVMKKRWYDMIVSGQKNEEYRDMTKYWIDRIWKHRAIITSVVFHKGYTNITHERECIHIGTGIGRKEWGAPEGEVIIIKLGDIINNNQKH